MIRAVISSTSRIDSLLGSFIYFHIWVNITLVFLCIFKNLIKSLCLSLSLSSLTTTHQTKPKKKKKGNYKFLISLVDNWQNGRNHSTNLGRNRRSFCINKETHTTNEYSRRIPKLFSSQDHELHLLCLSLSHVLVRLRMNRAPCLPYHCFAVLLPYWK